MVPRGLYTPRPMDTHRTHMSWAARVKASLNWLARYEPLLDDPQAFHSALEEPPPVDLLVLPQRTTPALLAAGLARRGINSSSLPGAPWHLRLQTDQGAGTLPEVLYGLAYAQGVSSAFGPQALAPRPGEKVLDLCAAPGGKTALLDALAEGSAGILAGEPITGRAGVLAQTVARCGAVGVTVVRQDGRRFPPAAVFDAILLDAPCTGEGTFRLPSPRFELQGTAGLDATSNLQRRLLGRALQLLAPGGRLLYSTCAYSPEENEAVLDSVLRDHPDVELIGLPAGTPGLPGIDRWQGTAFRKDLHRARRIFPHHTGSWGFFLALLCKSPDAPLPPESPPSPRESVEDDAARKTAELYFGKYFGVELGELEGFRFLSRGRDIWVRSCAGVAFNFSRLEIVAPGVRLIHGSKNHLMPTNGGLRWLGPRLKKGLVDLDWQQALELVDRGTLPLPGFGDRVHGALRVNGTVIGKGQLRNGMLTLDLPAGWR